MWHKSIRSIVVRYYAFHLFCGMQLFASLTRPFFIKWGRLDDPRILELQSIFMISNMLFEFPTGIIADRFGRKSSIVMGGILSAIGMVVYGWQPDYNYFMAGEIILALSSSFLSGADKALLRAALTKKGQVSEYVSITASVSVYRRIGGFIGSLIGTVVVAHFGLNYIMIGSAIPSLIAMTIACTFPEQFEHRSSTLQLAKKGMVVVIRDKEVRRITINVLVAAPCGYYILWLYQPFMEYLRVPETQYWWYYSILSWSQAGLVLMWPVIARIFGGPRRYFICAGLVPAAGLMLSAAFPGMVTLVLFVSIVGSMALTRPDILINHTAKYIDEEVQASTGSFINAMRVGFLALLNRYMGYVIGYSPFAGMVVAGLFGLLVFLFPLRDEHFGKLDEE